MFPPRLEKIPSLRVPLQRNAFLEGVDLEGNVSGTPFSLFSKGVLVTRRGLISAHSPDLKDTLWEIKVEGWPSSVLYENTVFSGGLHHPFLVIDANKGKVKQEWDLPDTAPLASNGEVVIVRKLKTRQCRALDLEGRVLWESDQISEVVSAGRYFLCTHSPLASSASLTDWYTGKVVWTFSPPKATKGYNSDQSNVINPGFCSLCAIGNRALVITSDFRVFLLDLKTGKVVKRGKLPLPLRYFVAERTIFLVYTYGLLQFDPFTMRQTNRIYFEDEMAPYFVSTSPEVRGFTVSREAVFFATGHGAIMGVSRKAGKVGRRAGWADFVMGAVMPIGVSPVIGHGHLYYQVLSIAKEYPSGLVCYGSVASPL